MSEGSLNPQRALYSSSPPKHSLFPNPDDVATNDVTPRGKGGKGGDSASVKRVSASTPTTSQLPVDAAYQHDLETFHANWSIYCNLPSLLSLEPTYGCTPNVWALDGTAPSFEEDHSLLMKKFPNDRIIVSSPDLLVKSGQGLLGVQKSAGESVHYHYRFGSKYSRSTIGGFYGSGGDYYGMTAAHSISHGFQRVFRNTLSYTTEPDDSTLPITTREYEMFPSTFSRLFGPQNSVDVLAFKDVDAVGGVAPFNFLSEQHLCQLPPQATFHVSGSTSGQATITADFSVLSQSFNVNGVKKQLHLVMVASIPEGLFGQEGDSGAGYYDSNGDFSGLHHGATNPLNGQKSIVIIPSSTLSAVLGVTTGFKELTRN